MTVYAFYLYNRGGVCLLYRRWHQLPKGKRGVEHETKLMWGLLFSMKELVNKMTPRQIDETEPTPLVSFTTHDSRVHYIETLTGLRLVLTTDTNQPTTVAPSSAPGSRSVVDTLLQIYRLWVEMCVKNPLYRSSDEGNGAATASNSLMLVECVRGGGGGGAVSDDASVDGERSLDVDCPLLVEKIVQVIEQLPYFH